MQLSPLSKLNQWGAPTLDGFDIDPNNISDGQRLKGSSNRQFVRFYTKKFLEFHADKVTVNEKTGTTTVHSKKPVEVEKLMVNIVTPGDKNEVDDVACEYHKREHWGAYQAHLKGTGAPIGMSLDDCGFVNPHIATDLRHYNCHTVEQLADASDHLCGIIPNGHELRDLARLQVKANLDNKSLEQVNILRAQNAALEARLLKLESGAVQPVATHIEAPTVRKRGPNKPKNMDAVA